MGFLSRRLFRIPLDDVGFERRGFRGGQDPAVRARIEKVGHSFLAGYHAALETWPLEDLVDRLDDVEPSFRGFAFEGAAMSLFMLDRLAPWPRRRFESFLEGAGGDHAYMAHVGAGWAMARLPFGLGRNLARLDGLLRWLTFDGYGFHQGYFDWPRAVEDGQEVPRWIRGYGRRAFDQGLGRSLWFVDGADVERIPQTIASFAAERREDLWAGVGLAATYAGGVSRPALERLRAAAGSFDSALAQGSAFAAKARQRAGNLTPRTETACQVFCGLSADGAAGVTDEALLDPGAETPETPAYEAWRQRIRQRFTGSPCSAPALAASV